MTAVLFDFGGTLDSDGQTWIDRFYAIYKENGVSVSRPVFDCAFHDADDGLPRRNALKNIGFEETVRLQALRVLELLAPDRLELAGGVAAAFVRRCRDHFERNRPVLARLSRKHRLGVVSNFYGNLDSVLRSEGLRDYFGAVADSGVVGRLKPEPEIFLHALEALGAPPQDSVMVGDSIARDMRGAEGLRMRHALLGTGLPCCKSAWRLSTLPELERFL